jgi:4-alpha-glucanotransferase
MMDRSQASVSTPFPPGYRASGILLHITSLPSRYGIGDLGPSARGWIDLLVDAGQSWWQSLPFGPAGHGNSPYEPLCTFAGNELLISPEDLVEEGLLRSDDCAGSSSSTTAVDYPSVIPFKRRLLETAWSNFSAGSRADLQKAFSEFCESEARWLEDYALFRALKIRFGGASYLNWPTDLVRREPTALNSARREVGDYCERIRFAQFLLFRQGARLKEYGRARGLRMLGDLPFYVSPDSSDVWANPQLFRLDEQHRPLFVAGVPPDYFSATGQLWGNPVYNWEALRDTGYRWWFDRLRALLAHVDMIRLDHFRAFAAAWYVPIGSASAQTGSWVPGPGVDFFTAAQAALGALPFIAEDLGLITPDVVALRDRFGLPGMRVLQFAFDGGSDNPHLPGNYPHNTVVYTGTHDNPTTRGWFEALPDQQRQNMWNCLQRPVGQNDGAAPALIELAWRSLAGIAIAPLQDLFNLGSDGRMNQPGQAEGNWQWRCTTDMLTRSAVWQWLRDLTLASGRAPALAPSPGTT